jgi:hypothetical protein
MDRIYKIFHDYPVKILSILSTNYHHCIRTLTLFVVFPLNVALTNNV